MLTLAPAVAGYQLRFVASIRLKFWSILWCSGGIGSWGCGPSFGVGSVNVGLVSHLGTNLDFAYGAILKGLVAWGGGNSGGAPLGGVLWLGGWLVVAFSVPVASP